MLTRITSSRTGALNVAADNQQVILNSNRTVNVAATKAAGINSWQYTDEVAVAMVSTDPGHVDFGVYFDQNSLRARDPLETKGNSLTIRLLDIKGGLASAGANPLKNNLYLSFYDNLNYEFIRFQIIYYNRMFYLRL